TAMTLYKPLCTAGLYSVIYTRRESKYSSFDLHKRLFRSHGSASHYRLNHTDSARFDYASEGMM
ncbi:MAG: hypothetical protein ACRYGR_09140, partial [Janthinobacterium lividum]